MKGESEQGEGRGANVIPVRNESTRASVLDCASPPALFTAETNPRALKKSHTPGRARHPVRRSLGVVGSVPVQVPASYTLPKPVLEKIWLERLRQKQLFREGKILFACDSPVVSHDRKLRVLTEKLGEIAAAIDQIEILNPLRQLRAEHSEPSARARNNLRNELTRLAAAAIAWLESLQKGKP